MVDLSQIVSNPYFIVLILSFLPVTEARGAIVYGMSLGLNLPIIFTIAVLANILPIPIIFWLLRLAHFNRFIMWAFGKKAHKSIKKYKKKLEDYGELALLLFVALPLPFTGAYIGALVATILDFNKIRSFIVISMGVVIMAILTILGTAGVLALV